jgi:hypothetical protein
VVKLHINPLGKAIQRKELSTEEAKRSANYNQEKDEISSRREEIQKNTTRMVWQAAQPMHLIGLG